MWWVSHYLRELSLAAAMVVEHERSSLGGYTMYSMGTFMCLYKIEKTMYFILTSNVKSLYKFT